MSGETSWSTDVLDFSILLSLGSCGEITLVLASGMLFHLEIQLWYTCQGACLDAAVSASLIVTSGANTEIGWDLCLVSLYWVLSLFGFGYHWDCQLNVSDWMHWADTCLLVCWWKDPSVSDPRFSVSASINRASAKLDEEWHRPCLKVPLSLKVMKTNEVVQVQLLEVRKIKPSYEVDGRQCNYLN
jgi:hypothetical protein